jgi:uncharacterized membrane protein YfcA
MKGGSLRRGRDDKQRGAKLRTTLAMIFATIGGAIGWWLGDMVGIFTALIVSSFTGAIGWYIGARIAREHLE